MGVRLYILLIFSLLGPTWALEQQASARPIDQARECISRFVKQFVVDPAVGKGLVGPISAHVMGRPDQIVSVVLERRLANGYIGTVYNASIADRSVVQGYSGKIVAKMANTWRARPSRQIRFYESRIRSEWEQSQAVIQAFPERHLPICPILGRLDSARGTILIKPEVQGLSLAEIAVQFAGRPTPEMVGSLKRMYDLAQDVYERAEVSPGKRFSLDIKPENLIWVTDSEVLRVRY